MVMVEINKKYLTLQEKIHAVRQKEKLIKIGNEFFNFLAILGIGILAAKIIESIFRFEEIGRIITDMVFLVVLASYFILKIIKPIFSFFFQKNQPDNIRIAQRIGKLFPFIGDRLANAIQIYEERNKNLHRYSPELIDNSLSMIYHATEDLDFKNAIRWKSVFRSAKFLIVVLAVYLSLHAVFYSQFSAAQNRLLHPLTKFQNTPLLTIDVIPGSQQVLKNDPVEIIARVQGEKVKKLYLHLNEVTNEYHVVHELIPQKENEFRYFIPHVQDTTEYYFSAGDFTSEKYILHVIELPLVRYLQVKITPPVYSGIKTRFLEENVGDIHCLKGSFAELSLISNKRLSKASIIINNKKQIQLNVSNNRASGGFRIREGGHYFIKLIDDQRFENQDPIVYQIKLMEDIYPNVYISYPGEDVDLTEDLILPLTIEADDDFGFSALRLGYRIIRSDHPFADTSLKFIPLTFETPQKEKLLVNFDWDLTPLDLFAGDVVRYYAEVFDNDDVSGPKGSRSQTYSARFPTLEEIFQEVNAEQENTYESFEGLYEKSKELKKQIDKLVQEMKQNPELKWEEKKKVEDVIETQKQLEKSLEEIQQELDQMIERMEKNDLLSLETLEKYNELQKLLDEILTDELKDALKKLQQATEQIDEKLLKQALEQLSFTQEEFLKSIEKTLNILKRLQIEQKLDELMKKAEQLLKEQQNINDQLEQSLSNNQINKLCQNQEDTKQKTSDLLTETNNLKRDMSEFSDMPEERIAELLEQAHQDGLLMNMGKVCKNAKAGKMEQAQQKGQLAANSLSNLLNQLRNAKQELIEKQKQALMAELKRLSYNFLTLSKKQESLMNRSKRLSSNSPQLTQLADQQQDLLNAVSRNADQMIELSQKTFFISPQMARAVGLAMKNMSNALEKFEERNINRTLRSQQRAMISLNEAIKQMISAMKQLAGASSASGLEEFLERLKQMSAQQQGINQQTLQLIPGDQPLSLSQQAAMARLAAQQQALKKTLEQLQQEFGERSEILGRLDGIGKEMEDVVKDFQKRKISRQTIRRQRKILQRLLDAQKSARRQDYSRRRKAETGKNYPVISPRALPKNMGDKTIQIQRDLIRALKEGYSRDYQELIKRYFEALMKETIKHEKN